MSLVALLAIGLMLLTRTSAQNYTSYGTVSTPYGLAVDHAGNMYVGEISGGVSYVEKIAVVGGVPQSSIVNSGSSSPAWLVFDGSQYIYVSDPLNHRLLRAPISGNQTQQVVIPLQAFSPVSPFDPEGLAIDSLGFIYVGDPLYSHVVKVAPNGTTLAIYSTLQTVYPSGLAVDGNGMIYTVPNAFGSALNSVFKLWPNGTLMTVFSVSPSTSRLTYVAVDKLGAIYATDLTNNRVVKLSANGTQAAVFNTSNPAMSSPRGLAIDDAGSIYVADSGNQRVVVFLSATPLVITPPSSSSSAPPSAPRFASSSGISPSVPSSSTGGGASTGSSTFLTSAFTPTNGASICPTSTTTCSATQLYSCQQAATTWASQFASLLETAPADCTSTTNPIFNTCSAAVCTQLETAFNDYPCSLCDAIGCYSGAVAETLYLFDSDVYTHSNCMPSPVANAAACAHPLLWTATVLGGLAAAVLA
jgi:hypothetical protein